MKFNFVDWKDKRVAMHCKTEEEAKDFCRVMHKAGMKWCSGERFLDNSKWKHFNIDTCYNFNNQTLATFNDYRAIGYTLLEWSDYMNKEFTKQDLKNGDICVRKDGNVGIAIPEHNSIVFQCSRDDTGHYKLNLKNCVSDKLDIVKVYRPSKNYQCSFDINFYAAGELVFDREKLEPIEVTIEEIAKIKGVSVDRIKIVKGE